MGVVIAVVGAGTPHPVHDEAAEAVGRGIAEAGATLVCGGLGGVMAAACRGAREAGGRTIGILPGTDRTAVNPFVDVAIPTGLGEARNTLVARAGDAVIAVDGEYGTLSEIAFALKVGVPVIGLDTWELRRHGAVDPGIRVATDPAEAVRLALAAAASRTG